MAVVVAGRREMAAAGARRVGIIGVVPWSTVPWIAAAGTLAITAAAAPDIAPVGPPCLAGHGTPGGVRVAHGAPEAGPTVMTSRFAELLVRQVVEIITVVCLEVMHGGEHDDEDQDDNGSQADDHDRGHRTIQGGMA
jgi:hypothetical protein